jgi:hypothetical protein
MESLENIGLDKLSALGVLILSILGIYAASTIKIVKMFLEKKETVS